MKQTNKEIFYLFRGMLFPETNETNIGHLHFLFLCLLLLKVSLINLFDYAVKPGMQISLFWAQ